MPVTALVIACAGSVCTYSAITDLVSLKQCERLAPIIAGMSRAEMTSLVYTPADQSSTMSFKCLDGQSGAVLMSFDSEAEELAAAR
ncbi:MAG: hypothetical protein HY055_03555 [Magnetospirillum sp.]|nr:hypothetical protein [Magnetospirillum sp.]